MTVDLAGVCTGPGPCDTTSFGAGKNWVNKVGGLPDYIRAVAHAFTRKGLPESQAIERAVGVVRNWAEGKGGITAATRTRAAAAIAEWETKKAASHTLTAEARMTVDLAWNEQLHPRSKGKFAPKGTPASSSSSALPANMAGNVRDFQKRNGLPVTGLIDRATAARIRQAAQNAKRGGRRKGVHTKRPFAAQQRALGQHVTTVNRLSTAQRAAVRRRMPVPPTGYVWGTNNTLRSVSLTAAQKNAPPTGL